MRACTRVVSLCALVSKSMRAEVREREREREREGGGGERESREQDY